MPNNDLGHVQVNAVSLFWSEEGAKQFPGEQATSLRFGFPNPSLGEWNRGDYTTENLLKALESAGYEGLRDSGHLCSVDPQSPAKLAGILYEQGWHVTNQGGIANDAYGDNFEGTVPKAIREFEAMSADEWKATTQKEVDRGETGISRPKGPMPPKSGLTAPGERKPSSGIKM